jgi:hypothetical protein
MTLTQQARVAGFRAQLGVRGRTLTLLPARGTFPGLVEHYQGPQPGSVADSGPQIIEPETRTAVRLAILDDPLVEPNEDFFIDLANPTDVMPGPPLKITILDNDLAMLRFATDRLGVSEGAGAANLEVLLSAASGLEVTVFPDQVAEPRETVGLSLSGFVNVHPGARVTAQIVIVDADQTPLHPLGFDSERRFRLEIVGPPGTLVRLEASPDLAAWSELAALENPSGSVEYTDAQAVGQEVRYYRASGQP